MEASISLKFVLKKETEKKEGTEEEIITKEKYSANLILPTTIDMENPFKFSVEQIIGIKEGAEEEKESVKGKVLEVAIVNDKNVYVAVAPPESILEMAKINETVEDLKVAVSQGKYSPEEGKFIE